MYWSIDGIILTDYLNQSLTGAKEPILDEIGSFEGLWSAWSKELDFKGDVRFVWELIRRGNTILPILLCPDDLDFSCLVIVVEVNKTKDFVYWNKIGYVLHENEDFEKEKKSGILHTDSYSDEEAVWQEFGKYISDDFKRYINEEVLSCNFMMGCVKKLE